MNKSEIIEKGTLKTESGLSIFNINLETPFSDEIVDIKALNIDSLNSEKEVNYMVDVLVNDILSFSEENKENLKEKIWIHYQNCIQNISYGMIDYASFQNEIEANKSYFNILNKEDLYKKVKLEHITLDLSYLDYWYFNLEYSCPWEEEHGIIISVNNGELDFV